MFGLAKLGLALFGLTGFGLTKDRPQASISHARVIQFLVAAAFLLFAPWSQSAHATTDELPSVVILYGDSITVGFNRETNFTQRYGSGKTLQQLPGSRPLFAMEELLNGTRPKRSSIIVNWGTGGSNSAHGVNRISSYLKSTESAHQGRHYYVLIMYGTNDIGSGISASTTAFNIRQMISASRAEGANFTPVISTITPRDDRDVVPYNSRIINEVTKDATALVDSYSAFINHPSGFTSLLTQETSVITGQPVRLHPNVSGYDLIAQTWFDQALAALIEPDRGSAIPGALLLLLDDDL